MRRAKNETRLDFTRGRRQFIRRLGGMAMFFALGNSVLEVKGMESDARNKVFKVSNCPVPQGQDLHEGLEALLDLMSWKGLNLYQTEGKAERGGSQGLVGKGDVVLIKVNAQWKYKGCTNSDLIRGLIRRILDHPEGFEGEVVIFENGQGEGALDGNPHAWGRYADRDVHVNAEDDRHSIEYLVDEIFKDARVSCYLLDDVRGNFISDNDHEADGYRKTALASYPCFTTRNGTRIELREGIWTGSGYSPNLKLINVPVLKRHDGCGVTACLKHYYGVLSMSYRPVNYHYEDLGRAVGELMTQVRGPVLNILDCVWVSPKNHYGRPEEAQRLNILTASVDPVALDYWASKYVLYPTDRNPELNPDLFSPFADYLKQAKQSINAAGGVLGRPVTFGDDNTDLVTYQNAVDEIAEGQPEAQLPASFVKLAKQRLDAGM